MKVKKRALYKVSLSQEEWDAIKVAVNIMAFAGDSATEMPRPWVSPGQRATAKVLSQTFESIDTPF